MEIDSPRRRGLYAERAEDCEDALEAAFDEYVGDDQSAFVDLAKVVAAITPDAVAAGWRCTEILDALHSIALRYQARVGNIRTRSDPQLHAGSGTTRH
ncbi:MAG: hypothetical protein JWR80_1033 [Bradyrhizobium sp.]|nr:hypothetical protein [Bradyrhizobium sp.]